MPFLAEEHVPIPTQDLLSWMFDNPRYDVDMPIYLDANDPSRTLSYRQSRVLVKKLAAGFQKAGLEKGDCVCMHAFNDIYYPILFLGIVAAASIFAGTNPSYTAHEIAHSIRVAEIKFFVTELEVSANVLTAASNAGVPSSRIFAFDLHEDHLPLVRELESKGVRSWRRLLERGQTEWERFNDDLHRFKIEPVARLFSSGTTGMPKALDLTHENFVSQHMLTMEYKPRPYLLRRLFCNPMFHVSQVPRAHTSVIRMGIPTYVMRRFELEPWLANLTRYQITELNLVPMIVIRILGSRLLETHPERYNLSSVRNAWTGSAPLDPSLQKHFKTFMPPDTPFNQAWGMSETTCVATWFYYPEEDTSGSVGRFIPNCDAKIVDDDGNDISTYGVRGELCVRGPIIVPGYFRNEEATRRDWDRDGYFHTDDIAYLSEKNKAWYIVDRKKELIKVRGFQVAPAEIEGVLCSHPNILDAAVIGVQQSITDSEVPRAYAVRRPCSSPPPLSSSPSPSVVEASTSTSSITEAEVKRHVRERLARYKSLDDGGVVFVDAIPRNASGKILKNRLRDLARWEMMRRRSSREREERSGSKL